MHSNPQLNKNGELQHLLTIEGLPATLLTQILDTAQSFIGVTEREVKKLPLLRGKAIFNLFFEPSTRTRTTFEIAAKRLSADVINLAISVSSQTKGETVLDTVANLSAMQADMFVVRHAASGAPYLIGSLVVVALATVAETLPFSGLVRGVVSYTKTGSQAWTEGAKIYLDVSPREFTTTSGGNTLCGVAVVAVGAGAGETTGVVRLDGVAR